jgi:hypothetical protein
MARGKGLPGAPRDWGCLPLSCDGALADGDALLAGRRFGGIAGGVNGDTAVAWPADEDDDGGTAAVPHSPQNRSSAAMGPVQLAQHLPRPECSAGCGAGSAAAAIAARVCTPHETRSTSGICVLSSAMIGA